MDIGEVAKLSGLPTSTIRYYEKKGLIQSNGRHGLRRQFSDKVVQRLALITLGVRVGFSLDELGAMFTMEEVNIDRDLLLRKADELDKKIQELSAMRNGLRHAAACDAPNHFECPKFLKVLRIVSKRPHRNTNRLKQGND